MGQISRARDFVLLCKELTGVGYLSKTDREVLENLQRSWVDFHFGNSGGFYYYRYLYNISVYFSLYNTIQFQVSFFGILVRE